MEVTPRPFGEVLAEGMTILGQVWRSLIPPAFGAFVMLGGLTIATFVVTGADDLLQVILNNPEALDDLTDEELIEPAVRLVQAAFISVALQLLATGFVNLTVHRIVASQVAGKPMGPRESASRALGRLPVLVGAGFIAFAAIFVGLLALIIPGIWLAGSLTMLSAVVALEDVGPVEALRRSFQLVRGRWWPTVGFLLLVGLLGSVAAQLVQLVALPTVTAGNVGLGVGLGFVLLIVVQGFVIAAIAVMTTVWYIDLRARQESLLTSSLS
jgi:hypothetical protein